MARRIPVHREVPPPRFVPAQRELLLGACQRQTRASRPRAPLRQLQASDLRGNVRHRRRLPPWGQFVPPRRHRDRPRAFRADGFQHGVRRHPRRPDLAGDPCAPLPLRKEAVEPAPRPFPCDRLFLLGQSCRKGDGPRIFQVLFRVRQSCFVRPVVARDRPEEPSVELDVQLFHRLLLLAITPVPGHRPSSDRSAYWRVHQRLAARCNSRVRFVSGGGSSPEQVVTTRRSPVPSSGKADARHGRYGIPTRGVIRSLKALHSVADTRNRVMHMPASSSRQWTGGLRLAARGTGEQSGGLRRPVRRAVRRPRRRQAFRFTAALRKGGGTVRAGRAMTLGRHGARHRKRMRALGSTEPRPGRGSSPRTR